MAPKFNSLGERVAQRYDAFGRRVEEEAPPLAPFVSASDRWAAFEPAQLFPADIQGAVEALSTTINAASTAAGLLVRATRLLQRGATAASTNPIETVIRNAVSQVDAFVTGIEGRTQCHAIMIPVRRRTVSQGPDQASLFEAFLDPDEPAYAYIQNMKNSRGGTSKFFKTLVESVSDTGDMNRPQFPSTYATAGVCLIAGAETLSDLQVPLRLFTNLFADNARIPPAGNTIPVVQDLKVTPAAVRGGTGVMLRWKSLPPRTNLPLYTSDTLKAQEIFIIRTEAPVGLTTWDALFPGVTISDDRDVLPTSSRATVVARLRNGGFRTAYTDRTNLLDPLKDYYFTTCVRYSINDEAPVMGPLSNVVRVTRRNPSPSTRQGQPPDWYATPSLARLLPPLDQMINRVRLEVSRLGARTSSNSGAQQMITQAVAQLERVVQQWDATTLELTEITDRLVSITALNAPAGVYSTVITQSTGGTEAWLAELSRRLADKTDTSRPEISDQSVVIGYVILAGAPRLPDLSALIGLLQLFFGKQAQNPLREANRSLDQVTAPVGGTTPSTATPVLGYDASMRPSPRPTC